ncbi:T9SS C-terminal target domain-containing protein [bacterium]|nr:MAG: T9SS C-terminal target domain-containing protein [bacterium]
MKTAISIFIITFLSLFNLNANTRWAQMSDGLGRTLNNVTSPSPLRGDPPMSGEYQVGGGRLYATLSAAVSDLNARGVSGAVTFLLTDPAYTAETLPITLSNISGVSATNTITIKPNTGVSTVISGASPSGAIIKVFNTNYVTIDGSNTEGGTTRNLTLTNTSATSPSVVWFGSNGVTPVTNLTLKNCIINNGAQSNTAVWISDGTTIGTAGYFNNITIQHNSIQKAYIGIYAIATVSAGNGNGLSITENDLNSSGADALRFAGVFVQGVDGATVSNNSIGNFESATGENDCGIWFAPGTVNSVISGNNINNLSCSNTGAFAPVGIHVSSDVASSNDSVNGNIIAGIITAGSGTSSGIYVSGATGNIAISKNKINDVKNNNSSGYGCNGIQLSSTSVSAGITVTNNVVFDIAGYGSLAGAGVTNNGYGIIVTGGAGYNIFYNTISMNTTPWADGFSAAFNVTSGVTTAGAINVRNNIFANFQTFGNRYSVYCGAANTVFSAIDYNNYYDSLGSNLGYLGEDRADLSAWKTATGKDANSVSGYPGFASLIDLSIDVNSIYAWNVSGMGQPLASVNVDYNSVSRSTTVAGGSTDIGAYNITPVSTPPSAIVTGTLTNNSTTTYTLPFGRLLGSLTWGADGTVPTAINFVFYPGVNPPGTGAFAVGNGYWVVTATGGSGYSYDVTFNYDESQIGNISAESKIRLVKSENPAVNGYTPYLIADDGSHAPGMYVLSTTNNTIKVYGLTSFSTFGISDADSPLPVELTSFTSNVTGRNVKLNWITASENNNAGFNIERKTSTGIWAKVGFVPGKGTINYPSYYSFDDRNLNTGKYNYRLKQIDANGNFEYHNLNTILEVGLPAKFDLTQNYPNPFNPTTKIGFQLPADGNVSIRIYDMAGREVKTLMNNEQRSAGYYTLDFNGSSMSSGTYFYRFIAESNGKLTVMTKQMIMVK